MVGLHGEDCYKEEKLLIKPTSDTIKKKILLYRNTIVHQLIHL